MCINLHTILRRFLDYRLEVNLYFSLECYYKMGNFKIRYIFSLKISSTTIKYILENFKVPLQKMNFN